MSEPSWEVESYLWDYVRLLYSWLCQLHVQFKVFLFHLFNNDIIIIFLTLGIIIIIIIPVLRIDGQAHGPVELRRDDVIEDVLRTKSCHGDPVVERVRPIDARRQPVDGHAIHLRRYAGINCV